MSTEPKICEVGGKGNLLPIFRDHEQEWPSSVRGILYLLGLGWCFIGVAIIADVFMGAIETITAKKVRKQNPETKRYMTVQVWNPTVANLTLMALGSSAPEILLSVIEILSNRFFSGALGPSTIVGSAAFNLLCITAVCVVAIPDKEFRYIKEMPVYIITASFSIFAYLWLLFILKGPSPEVIDIWEGVLTFLFFPIMVFLAYLADLGYFSKTLMRRSFREVNSEMTKEELAEIELSIRRQHGENLTDEQVQKFIACEYEKQPTRAIYRVQAIRGLTGGKRVNTAAPVMAHHSVALNSVVPFESSQPAKGAEEAVPDISFGFEAKKYAVLESVGDLDLPVVRYGNSAAHASVGVRTRDGSAKSNTDYMPIDVRVEFPPGITKQIVTVSIIDDSAKEDDEEFFVDLHDPNAMNATVGLGEHLSTTVTIIDDDLPGTLEFADYKDDTYTVQESVQDRDVDIVVQRSGGSTGKVGCSFRTEDASAIAPSDYEHLEGTLELESGQMSAHIKLKIKASGRYERTEHFRLILSDPTGGARLDPKSDGGADSTILTVVIKSEEGGQARVDKLFSALQVNWDKSKVGHANWRDQFVSALYVNGGEDEDGNITMFDRFVHMLCLPWKLLVALVPPTDYMDGWLCFIVAIVFIGGVTALIGDMANLLGCVMGIQPSITAITFVALGTSLPDTFASKTAAEQDKYADASIGNVTGSNSVNVFLGLGLPWMLASVYWQVNGPNARWIQEYGHLQVGQEWPGGAFVVLSGDLGFSVTVFSGCAVTCLATLYLRRRLFSGELGGPIWAKYATGFFFVSLWATYIGLSIWTTMS